MAEDKERRMNCRDCVSHLQHREQLDNLKEDTLDCVADRRVIWNSVDNKVSYGHFKWAFGILITTIVLISTINYGTMNRVLSSNHDLESDFVRLESKVERLTEKLAESTQEHAFYRESIVRIMDMMTRRLNLEQYPTDESQQTYRAE